MEPVIHILKQTAKILLVVSLTGLAACSRFENSAALNPYQYAPPSHTEPWQVSGTPLPLGRVAETNSANTLSSSNLPPLTTIPDSVEKTNDLADLIDIAQRANPHTRAAWEQARAAAARLGLADSAYAPVLALLASGGYSHSDFPAPGDVLVASGPGFNPSLSLEWTLLDFGKRRATFDVAAQQLLQANFQFNRTHQQLAYDVQRTFYAFDSSHAQLDAAQATLTTAQTVEHVASLRLENGLTTQSDLLQARQELARAKFDLQSAQRSVSDTWALLAENLGISPATNLKIIDLSALPMPTNLVESVQSVIDRTLQQRPDLAAQLSELRASEAAVRRAQADFRPTISLSGSAGGTMGSWDVKASGSPDSSYDYADPQYGAFLNFSWNVFDGFLRKNKLREAQAKRDEDEAHLTALELKTLGEVWKAYADAKASFVEYDFALSLLTASQDAYDAALKSYQNGLGTVIELLTAERDLARARTTLVESRAEVLTSSAALAFAAGDWSSSANRMENSTNGRNP